MSLADVNDREFVLLAAKEFDKLGRDSFLAKYGFEAARKYFVVINGKEYDSKAIVGVAHKFARPGDGALHAAEFSGGYETVVSTLRELGFSIRTRESVEAEESSIAVATALVLVENEVTYDSEYEDWEDLTGTQYHFPNVYKNRILTGRPFVYYRGVRRTSSRRGQAEYFGVGRIGRKWPSPMNREVDRKSDWKWYCEILDFTPFDSPVPATNREGARFERITNARDWGVGVRVLTIEKFEQIISETQVDWRRASPFEVGADGDNPLGLPPIDDVEIDAATVRTSLLRTVPNRAIPQLPGSQGSSARRSKHSKDLGDRAEELALRWLRRRLSPFEADTLRWVARLGETPGWDIEYLSKEGVRIAVEVKGCSAKAMSSLEVTANEWRAATLRRGGYQILMVASCASRKPLFDLIIDPAGLVGQGSLAATPNSWLLVRTSVDADSQAGADS